MTTTLDTRPTGTDLHDDDRITITGAGLAALRGATIVPDDAEQGEQGEDLVLTSGEESAAPCFVPDTKEKADWVLGKIADARARAARIRENAERMARQAEGEAEHLEWKYGAALQDLARRELAYGKRKSLSLYHGTLGFRTRPAGVTVTDEADALVWAQLNAPEALTTRLDRKALREALEGLLAATGEVVPFAQFTPEEEVFYIR
jgi:hypothetical protein